MKGQRRLDRDEPPRAHAPGWIRTTDLGLEVADLQGYLGAYTPLSSCGVAMRRPHLCSSGHGWGYRRRRRGRTLASLNVRCARAPMFGAAGHGRTGWRGRWCAAGESCVGRRPPVGTQHTARGRRAARRSRASGARREQHAGDRPASPRVAQAALSLEPEGRPRSACPVWQVGPSRTLRSSRTCRWSVREARRSARETLPSDHFA